MVNLQKLAGAIITIFYLVGCGGSSSSGGDGDSSNSTDMDVATNTGVIIDSPVINISYRTETLEGVTNALGEYEFVAGENVTFFIGDLEFPAVTATGMVTPLELAGTQDVADPRVINIIRLLQTLDRDGDPSNGISITEEAKTSATQVDFNLTESDFATSPAVLEVIANANLDTPLVGLVSTADALDHFRNELIKVGVLPAEFNFTLYDDFSDPNGDINFDLWATDSSANAASTVAIENGSLIATAVKDSEVRRNQGLWVKNATAIMMSDSQAISADFKILEATGDATNRAQMLLGLALEEPDYFVDTGINFYASGEIEYYIEIYNRLELPITEIAFGTITTVEPGTEHTLSIGWDGSNYVFQVDEIVPVVIPMTAETQITQSSSWGWASVRATVKDDGTGTTVAQIDNVKLGSLAQ